MSYKSTKDIECQFNENKWIDKITFTAHDGTKLESSDAPDLSLQGYPIQKIKHTLNAGEKVTTFKATTLTTKYNIQGGTC
jgi:hypothetical protein